MRKSELSFNEEAKTMPQALGMNAEEGARAIEKIASFTSSLGEEGLQSPAEMTKHLIENFSQEEIAMLAIGNTIRLHQVEMNPLARLAHMLSDDSEDETQG